MGFDWINPKNYKTHYICLDCQKGFKRSNSKELKHQPNTDFSSLMEDFYEQASEQDIIAYIQKAYDTLKVKCPNCSNQMVEMHYNFEVPPQRDNKAWKEIRLRYANKLLIPFENYIHWHELRIRATDNCPERQKLLAKNLKKLQSQ